LRVEKALTNECAVIHGIQEVQRLLRMLVEISLIYEYIIIYIIAACQSKIVIITAPDLLPHV
jgi:hypothetical protein